MPDLTPPSRLPAVPSRPIDSHKGTFGTVLVLAGSETMPGAAALCATAALRSGAGLCRIMASPSVLGTVLTVQPGATGIVLGKPEDLRQLIDAADPQGSAVLAVGPGLGADESVTLMVRLALESRRPMVLDADGLNALASQASTFRRTLARRESPLILTPHPGECRRLAAAFGLTGDAASPADRPRLAGQLAAACQAVVVLKGHGTVIARDDHHVLNPTGNPVLATAGSGDVLTGCIAALIAQGLSPFDAAVLGAYLHGLAADRWAARHGRSGLLATDLCLELPDAFEQHRRAREA